MHKKHLRIALLTTALCAVGMIAPVLAQQVSNGTCGESYNYADGNRFATSDYGQRDSQQGSQGATSSFHKGIDIRVTDGNATSNSYMGGTVVQVGNNPSGYGNFVIVEHTNGFRTMYAHASQTLVTVGQSVTAGQTLGDYSGSCTGNCTGPHIHYETQINVDGNWVKVDPAQVENVVGMGWCPNTQNFAEFAMFHTLAEHGITSEQLQSGGQNLMTLDICNDT